MHSSITPGPAEDGAGPAAPRSRGDHGGSGDDAPHDEAAQIQRAVQDPEAFAALYRRHHAAIARYVRRRVGDAELVHDLIAETFLVALEELPRYRHRGLPLRAWLYRLATSRVNRWVRRDGRRRTTALDHEPVSPAADEPDDDERREIARRALRSLPIRWQGALALHYLEELPVVEVARILDCREGTVKSRLARGREALRRRLHEMGWDR